MNDTQIWTFNYKKAPAPATTANVGAHDEAEAFLVAQAWCAKNGSRFFGSVRPFIVAGPEILGDSRILPEVPAVEPLASPVEATTGTMDRIRQALGR